MAGEVRSGDTTNVEAHAAKVYWRHWLIPTQLEDDEPFRRDPNGAGLNAFLNYGYAIMRAAIGRALVASGLEPRLGLHHSGRSNAFCLADDLIEPFRPLVDERVREMHRQGHETLNQPAKAELLNLLAEPMTLAASSDEITGPLMVMLHRMTASLARCYAGESKRLDIPTPRLDEGPSPQYERAPCKSRDTD